MRPLKYKILPHTADLRLEVRGKTLEELFENGAEAMADILSSKTKFNIGTSDVPNIKNFNFRTSDVQKLEIKIKSPNLNALLVDFLNEILSRSHINKAVYQIKKINIRSSDDQNIELQAELIGYPVEEFDEDIKAVTYHEVQIEERAAKGEPRRRWGRGKVKSWQTKLVLDI